MLPADIYSITEITRRIKYILEMNIPTVWVQGEISNFTHHSSGHMYFTLKDEECQITSVMWREDTLRLFFTPRDGMKVAAQGDVTVYERAGRYQLRMLQMQPLGIGELQMAFERLKERLLHEGLFADEHKKSLPPYPTRIGIVTSPSGAAFGDIAQIIRRRLPGTHLVLIPVKVQGEGAAEEIARAIDDGNAYGEMDVLILTRGGGSLEDLWAFNEEKVARAIFNSRIPVVSAIGHEVDFTISDFVADLRAPTPSAAAELVVPDGRKLFEKVHTLVTRMEEHVERHIQFLESRVTTFMSSYGLRYPLDILRQYEQRRDELEKDLCVHMNHVLARKEEARALQIGKLEGLNPLSVLRRGYSICRKVPEKTIIREAATLKVDDGIEVTFHKG